ncbi:MULTISPECIES: TrmH family RNA methyltransferase [Methylobacterium]|uniref:RNA methyltransferase n=1 Tax=Methylobacterium longum TaxID=767694 RepID=A0ABT8AIW0_9HYPH|nr:MULTISPECIES: RNA methyltransferase [Methylobacterium]MCJ2100469.1 RNA methyltransferase [Methylobacterium sp. E-046]MDN3569458.1 RNA methyltransferase [Methylobacterium longum]GJE10675.1 23S rRNA (guanosine-2'-O-)-methyltransferase RlmB [Methylobacterium longum]
MGPAPETVTDPGDPRLDPYTRMRERDLVGRAGRFVVEGEVTLRLLLGPRSRFRAESILLAPERWPGLADAVAACPAPVYLAAKAVMSAVTGFPIHRGVLAIGVRGGELDAAAPVPPRPAPALVLGLAGLTNHDNVGAAFRNAAAFGADAVLLDAESCDPLYRKSIRVSAGAALIQPFARLPAGQDWLRLAQTLDLQPLAFSPGAVEPLDALAVPARALLILGTEGPGLDPATLAGARPIRIPMAAGFDSLNVATAAGIALHAIARGQGRLDRAGTVRTGPA